MTKWTPEFRKEYGRLYRGPYYLSHKTQIDAYSKAYNKKYPEKLKRYVKKYQEKNLEVLCMYNQLRNLLIQDRCW